MENSYLPRSHPVACSCSRCLRMFFDLSVCPYCGGKPESVPLLSPRFSEKQSSGLAKDHRPAGSLVRSLVYLADIFLIGLTFATFWLAVYAAVEISRNFRWGEGMGGFPYSFIILAFLVYQALYFTFFPVYEGSTPGMKIFRLKLIRVDQQQLSGLRVFLRWLLSVSLGLLVLGFWWGIFSRHKQNFHDLVTGTCVVRA